MAQDCPHYCDLCSKEFSGNISAQQHFISEAHLRKEDQKKNAIFQSGTQPFWCGPCNLQCNSSQQFSQHIESPRHKEIVKRSIQISSKMNNMLNGHTLSPSKGNEYDFNGTRGFCHLCNIELTSPEHAKQHLSGSKHKKKKDRSGDGDNGLLQCSICQVPFSCQRNAEEHLISKKHLKKKMELEQMEPNSYSNLLDRNPVHGNVPDREPLMLSPPDLGEQNHENTYRFSIEESRGLAPTQLSSSLTLVSYPGQSEIRRNVNEVTETSKPDLKHVPNLPLNIQPDRPFNTSQPPGSNHGNMQPSLLNAGYLDTQYGASVGPIGSSRGNTNGAYLDTQYGTSVGPIGSSRGNTQPSVRNGAYHDTQYGASVASIGANRGLGLSVDGGDLPPPLEFIDSSPAFRNNPSTKDPFKMSELMQVLPQPKEQLVVNCEGASQLLAKKPYIFNGNRGRCNVCNIELTSNQHANQHLAGKNHAKALMVWEANNSPKGFSASNTGDSKQPYRFDGNRGFCNVCRIELTSEAHAQQHLSGNPHRKALSLWQSAQEGNHGNPGSQQLGPVGNNYQPGSQQELGTGLVGRTASDNKPSYVFTGTRGRCFVCDIELTSREHATQHLQGSKHTRAEERQKLFKQNGSQPLECKVCLKSFSGPESAAQHYASAKHRSKAGISSNNSALLQEHASTDLQATVGMLSSPISSPGGYTCEVCHCPLNTFEQLSIHKKSPSHLKNVEKMERFISGMNANGELDDSSGSSPRPEDKRENVDVWNALRTGELTTVGKVSANVNPMASNPFQEQNAGGLEINSFPGVIPNGGTVNRSTTGLNGVDTLVQHGVSSSIYTAGSSTSATVNNPSQSGNTNNNSASSLSSGSDMFVSASGVDFRKVKHDPLKNSNKRYRGNKVNIGSYENLDSDEDQPIQRSTAFGLSDFDDSASFVSFNSNASNLLSDRFGSIMTDNNPRSVSSLSRSDMSLLSDLDSVAYPSSNAGLVSGFIHECLPERCVENPYKGIFKYYCETCKRPMNTKKDYDLHLESRGHQQRSLAVTAPADRDLGPIVRELSQDEAAEQAYSKNSTKTMPRSYQVELFCKVMEGDKVVFLPTGTGKTLVSVMAVSCMLLHNPRRPVLFLVDKVLLVLQQAKYIVTEIGDIEYERLSLDMSQTGLVMRKPKIAMLCGDLLPADSTPLYRHDVVVATAAYAQNLLLKGYIRWEDFSLVVVDEAHHCVKRHPFNRLLEEHHRPCPPETRPKILGLTASPAGRDSVTETYVMLKELFQNLGGATIAIVQSEVPLHKLEEYQSNAKLVVDFKPYSDEERDFRQQLHEYICHCYVKLTELSNLASVCDWELNAMRRNLTQYASDLDPNALNKLLHVLDTLQPSSEDQSVRVKLDLLTKHTKIVLLALSDMDGCGMPAAVSDLQHLIGPDGGSVSSARELGLDFQVVENLVTKHSHSAQVHQEFEEDTLHISLYIQLLQTLNNATYINWRGGDHPMALILVRERAHAHKLSNFLKQTTLAAKNDLKITSVVGHGSGAADGGMKVKQQKRVLDGVRNKRYDIIVATAVAEEGVDIPECELVVCMNPPSTVTGLVQMRGRARKKDSYFVILCKSRDEEDKINGILQRERFMVEAAQLCVQQAEAVP